MPLELGVWRIQGGATKEVQAAGMDNEQHLEDILAADISIASPNWIIIGRQVQTSFNGRVDLLAMDQYGKLIVIELKKDRTPRDVVAQTLDYASWVRTLRTDEVVNIFDKYQERWVSPNDRAESFDTAFCHKFRVNKLPEDINDDHELVVVAATLDDSTERIVTYLSDIHGVPINAVFFRVFQDGETSYLTRAWLRDPTAPQSNPDDSPSRREWNGEFYFSFGPAYDWEKARKYGYVTAGGGQWYSRTLSLLKDGCRIWVNSPGTGYIGVAVVEDSKPLPASEFLVDQKGQPISYSQVADADTGVLETPQDDENSRCYLVKVRWLKTVPLNQAISERGFFGNQNIVCKPISEKWEFTIKRLKKRFDIQD
jgi:hypothetical protein